MSNALLPLDIPDREEASVPLQRLPRHNRTADEAFVNLIRTEGLLTPIWLIRNADGKFTEIPAGNRRVSAYRQLYAAAETPEEKARYAAIPAVIFPEGYINPETLTLTDNMARTRNFPAELEAVEGLLARGHAPQDIAREMGINAQQIKQMARLIYGLHPDLLAGVKTGKIKKSAALEAIKFHMDEQATLVEDFKRDDKLTTTMIHDYRSLVIEDEVKALETAGLFDVPSDTPKTISDDGKPALPDWYQTLCDALDILNAGRWNDNSICPCCGANLAKQPHEQDCELALSAEHLRYVIETFTIEFDEANDTD